MSEVHSTAPGSVSAAISNAGVRILQEYTGRGPTKARTTVNRDSVMILFGDVLTKGERKLAEKGDAALVLQMRHRFQGAMREDLVAMVEEQMGRSVVAFMSDNHIDPDLGGRPIKPWSICSRASLRVRRRRLLRSRSHGCSPRSRGSSRSPAPRSYIG